jgi:hypothetical protein
VRADVAVAWVDRRIWCVQDARRALTDGPRLLLRIAQIAQIAQNASITRGFDAETWSKAGESQRRSFHSRLRSRLYNLEVLNTGNG